MSKLGCIIVEDEPLAAKVLSDYISHVPFLELRGTFKNALLASEYLQDHSIDLMFLDIHLPKLKGMAFIRSLTNPPAIIITSAYHQYAVDGFNLDVVDYLLKPFAFERFLAAVTKVKRLRGVKADLQEAQGMKEYIFVNVQKKKVKVLFSEIVYIESQREYVRIKTTTKEYISKISTGEIEALLPPRLFKRIHRSFIIAVGKIESYTADQVNVHGISLPIGRGYRKFLDHL
jgi:DNA-binding LytR/AlgR family response regulator